MYTIHTAKWLADYFLADLQRIFALVAPDDFAIIGKKVALPIHDFLFGLLQYEVIGPLG
jgi:hypothetical protein